MKNRDETIWVEDVEKITFNEDPHEIRCWDGAGEYAVLPLDAALTLRDRLSKEAEPKEHEITRAEIRRDGTLALYGYYRGRRPTEVLLHAVGVGAYEDHRDVKPEKVDIPAELDSLSKQAAAAGDFTAALETLRLALRLQGKDV
jgi:hypothetical protein